MQIMKRYGRVSGYLADWNFIRLKKNKQNKTKMKISSQQSKFGSNIIVSLIQLIR